MSKLIKWVSAQNRQNTQMNAFTLHPTTLLVCRFSMWCTRAACINDACARHIIESSFKMSNKKNNKGWWMCLRFSRCCMHNTFTWLTWLDVYGLMTLPLKWWIISYGMTQYQFAFHCASNPMDALISRQFLFPLIWNHYSARGAKSKSNIINPIFLWSVCNRWTQNCMVHCVIINLVSVTQNTISLFVLDDKIHDNMRFEYRTRSSATPLRSAWNSIT